MIITRSSLVDLMKLFWPPFVMVRMAAAFMQSLLVENEQTAICNFFQTALRESNCTRLPPDVTTSGISFAEKRHRLPALYSCSSSVLRSSHCCLSQKFFSTNAYVHGVSYNVIISTYSSTNDSWSMIIISTH